MRFGQFLIMEGAVPEEAVAVALRLQRRSAVPLGELAIRTGRLDRTQVRELLRAQARQVEYRRLGQLAVGRGLLNDADVVRLLAEQRRGRPRIGELLVRAGELTPESLDRLLHRFVEHNDAETSSARVRRPGAVAVTRPGGHVPASTD